VKQPKFTKRQDDKIEDQACSFLSPVSLSESQENVDPDIFSVCAFHGVPAIPQNHPHVAKSKQKL
jgi:hypothetical protein